jgi:hypothetical protein
VAAAYRTLLQESGRITSFPETFQMIDRPARLEVEMQPTRGSTTRPRATAPLAR